MKKKNSNIKEYEFLEEIEKNKAELAAKQKLEEEKRQRKEATNTMQNEERRQQALAQAEADAKKKQAEAQLKEEERKRNINSKSGYNIKINLINKWSKKSAINTIKQLATNDSKTLVQASAIETLGKLTDPELIPVFIKALQSKSYSVLGKSLVSLYYVDKQAAIAKSKELPDEVRKILATPLTRIFIEEKFYIDQNF